MPAKQYTRIVAWIRSSLWLMIATIIGVVIWIASDNSGDGGMRVVFSNIAKSANLQNIMMKPHYQGVDSHNQPFTVIAEKATQLDEHRVVLDKVRGDLMTSKGAWVAVNADAGKLDITSRQLELTDKVNMFYEGGYEFRSDYAHIDIEKGRAYGNLPIEGQGPAGTLTADSFEVGKRGEVIRFQGNVKMTLYR